ncbi:hypothetical protein ABZX30_30225 [Streptomyces sp. NPDC004542]|uniref:hypothetical protein n=1 Tax=Streptomyces sp. NPDC004542 TaxID=3154281 RepID=UPI0033BE7C30
MTADRPHDSDIPEDRDDLTAFPDEVWQRFSTDSERAIRRSAPREPSARERAARASRGAGTGRTVPDTVGEPWWPDESGSAWHALDGRARRRRVGRALGVVAVLAVVGVVTWATGPSGPPVERGTTSTESVDAPDEAPAVPAGPGSPVPPRAHPQAGQESAK